MLYLIGTDFIKLNIINSLILYQGSFNTINLLKIFLILPTSIFVEKVSIFINLEGRLRKTYKAIASSNLIFNDFEVIKAIYFFKNFYFSFYFTCLNVNQKIIKNFLFIHLYIDYSCIFNFPYLSNLYNFFSCFFANLKFFIHKLKILNGIFSIDFDYSKIFLQ